MVNKVFMSNCDCCVCAIAWQLLGFVSESGTKYLYDGDYSLDSLKVSLPQQVQDDMCAALPHNFFFHESSSSNY